MTLQEIIVQTEELTSEEKTQLATYLMAQAELQIDSTEDNIKWTDIAGTATYPLAGEDAQVWVTRTRQEEERDLPWSEH